MPAKVVRQFEPVASFEFNLGVHQFGVIWGRAVLGAVLGHTTPGQRLNEHQDHHRLEPFKDVWFCIHDANFDRTSLVLLFI